MSLFDCHFRFVNSKINSDLILAISSSCIEIALDSDGCIYYHYRDTEWFNKVLDNVRSKIFERDSWRVFYFEEEIVDLYRKELKKRNVYYEEEINNGKVGFLVKEKYRVNRWKISK